MVSGVDVQRPERSVSAIAGLCFARVAGRLRRQLSKAVAAASMAAVMSGGCIPGTVPIETPLAGFFTVNR